MFVQILVDNINSWIVPYAEELVKKIEDLGMKSVLIHKHEEVIKGDILCLLSCEKVFRRLELNTHNLVVHESDLPLGKGWSPLTWQILGGKNIIPVTLFEASEKVDSGVIYLKKYLKFNGTELLPEMKRAQGVITQELVLEFLRKFPRISPIHQYGPESYYPKRQPKDSKLDTNKSIQEQFNLLRVCDNERYPAFFYFNNNKYILKIYRDNE